LPIKVEPEAFQTKKRIKNKPNFYNFFCCFLKKANVALILDGDAITRSWQLVQSFFPPFHCISLQFRKATKTIYIYDDAETK